MHDDHMHERAWELRQAMTPAERVLWKAVRSHQFEGIHFRRQHTFGEYCVDFCCTSHRLIVELDGGIHAMQREYNAEREQYLQACGYRIVRVSNERVLQRLPECLHEICAYLAPPTE